MKNILIFALIIIGSVPAAGAQVAEPPVTGVDEIMAKVFVRDRQREKISEGYVGQRRYVFDNEKWHKHAELLVAVKGDPDGSKHFEVLKEEGWKSANRRVLRKMLDSESETSQPANRPKTLLTPDNYSFSLLRTDVVEGRTTYVITVGPKRRDKYLFEGQIWVDAVDYAVVRCEGRPARNPSFWTRSIHFVHQYQKSGDFWYPHATESVTEARIFGKTNVVIHYFDYTPNAGVNSNTSLPQNVSLHEDSYVTHH